MALVRRGGKLYLYRSVRRGSRVTSEYVASGLIAELIAEKDRRGRDLRRLASSEDPEERRRRDELEQTLDALAEDARALAHEVLEAAGFHQHKRGEWRRRRGKRR